MNGVRACVRDPLMCFQLAQTVYTTEAAGI